MQFLGTGGRGRFICIVGGVVGGLALEGAYMKRPETKRRTETWEEERSPREGGGTRNKKK